MTAKQALQLSHQLKKYCRNKKSCDGCIFLGNGKSYGTVFCGLEYPKSWVLKKENKE